MLKFALSHVKGDNEIILETLLSKEEAIRASSFYREKYSNAGGLISCIEAMLDDKNQHIGHSIRLHEVYLLPSARTMK